MTGIGLTRRHAIALGATVPLLGGLPVSARADATPAVPTRTFRLGQMQVTTLLSTTRPMDMPQSIFGMNVSADEFAKVSAQNFLPADRAQFYFTPTLVQMAGRTVLFDTGLSAAAITGALAAAGVAPAAIDTVVITHMHPDHIGGLMEGKVETFPNASYLTAQAEFDHWARAENEIFEAKVRPLAEKFSFVADGSAIAPGVTAMAAFGHTPGHTTYMLESEGELLLLAGDLANHYVWSLAYPDWEVKFDMDKAAAAASRRKVLGMLAADRIPMIGYHMPFPAAGYVQTRQDGFRYVPVSYQMMG